MNLRSLYLHKKFYFKLTRPIKKRRLITPPLVMGFKPFGIPLKNTEFILLKFEEYESFKLINYDKLDQDKASVKMAISRPTFTRIYNAALQKIAIAWVEGKAIRIEGGNFIFDTNWYRCKKCFKLIEGIDSHLKCMNCKSFNTDELIEINRQNEIIIT